MGATKQTDLVKLVYDTTLETETKETLTEKFRPLFDKMMEWKAKADALVVTSSDQKDEMKQAKDARLALKNIRVEADKTRKALKEDSLKFGNAVQAVYNMIEEKIKPIEAHLQIQENFAETERLRKIDELTVIRQKEITQYSIYVLRGIFNTLGELSEEDYLITFNSAKALHDARIKAEEDRKAEELRQAEAKRQAREKEAEQRRLAEAEACTFIQDEDSNKLQEIQSPEPVIGRMIEDGTIQKTVTHEVADAGVLYRERYSLDKAPPTQHIGGMPFQKRESGYSIGGGYTPPQFTNTPIQSDKAKLLDLAKLIDNIAMPIVRDQTTAAAILVNVRNLLTKVTTYIKQKAEGLQ